MRCSVGEWGGPVCLVRALFPELVSIGLPLQAGQNMWEAMVLTPTQTHEKTPGLCCLCLVNDNTGQWFLLSLDSYSLKERAVWRVGQG